MSHVSPPGVIENQAASVSGQPLLVTSPSIPFPLQVLPQQAPMQGPRFDVRIVSPLFMS